MTPNQFRRIALGLPGAIESAHMGHPDFRAHGRIFATLTADGSQGMVKLTLPQQKVFVDANRGTFEPASGAWGRQGCTMVALKGVDEETVGEAMTLAWRNAVSQEPPKKRARSAARRR